ncbi:MAG TPA: hypothetical protein VFQ45_15140 [Longimicrobium sp.]|nr:hypothetical protein [Longimicrobium sp.]
MRRRRRPQDDARERTRRRLRVAALAVALAVSAAALTASLVKVRPARISALVRATGVAFRVPRAQVLAVDLAARRVTVSGASHVLPSVPGWAPEHAETANGLNTSMEADSGDALTLGGIPLPAGSSVRVESTAEARTFRVHVTCAPSCDSVPGFKVDARGPVAVVSAGFDGTADFGSGRPVWFSYGTKALTVEVELLVVPFESAEPLDIDALRFDRRTVYADPVAPRERILSSVRAGTIRLEDVPGKEIQLPRGEELHLDLRAGSLRQLTLDSAALEVNLLASADGFATGTTHRSRLPSQLERLHSHLGLHLVLATVLAVFPILFGLTRWWFEG